MPFATSFARYASHSQKKAANHCLSHLGEEFVGCLLGPFHGPCCRHDRVALPQKPFLMKHRALSIHDEK